MLRLCLSWIAIGALSAEEFQWDKLQRPIVEARLEKLSTKLSERQATLKALFSEAGCAVVEQPVRRSKYPNVVCTLRGQGESTIVVGAHYDHDSSGSGAVDNWSGAAMLPSLYQALANRPRRHHMVFVGFAAEEKGLIGSRHYVQQLSKQEKSATLAYVNLDSLGLGDVSVWLSRADRRLAAAYGYIAHAIGMRAVAVDVDKVGDDDSHTFRDAGVPTISFHSVTQKTYPILHSSRDRLNAIDRDCYYRTYTLLAAYLAYLDAQPQPAP